MEGESRVRWYWAWRRWRVSTWIVLFWSALLWPEIIRDLASDEFLAGAGAFILTLVWLVGAGVVVGVRRWRRRRWRRGQSRGAPSGRHVTRADAFVRAALPFAAAVLLVTLVASPILEWHASRPTDVEAAVEREWRGPEATIALFAIGGGDPATTQAEARAEEVSCAETEATVRGAPVHVCEIVYCDPAQIAFLSCPPSTTPACAALVENGLVLVSSTGRAGPAALQNALRAAHAGCR